LKVKDFFRLVAITIIRLVTIMIIYTAKMTKQINTEMSKLLTRIKNDIWPVK